MIEWAKDVRSPGPRAIVAIVTVLLPALLFALSAPELWAGWALERIAPIVTALQLDAPIDDKSATRALRGLDGIPAESGAIALYRAELLERLLARAPTLQQDAESAFRAAIKASPAEPRSWIGYCEVLSVRDPLASEKCLNTAFSVGPLDWFVGPRRAALAARLWISLDPETRYFAIRQIQMLYEEPKLRKNLIPLTKVSGGRALLTAALRGNPDDIRAFNRFVIEQRFRSLSK